MDKETVDLKLKCLELAVMSFSLGTQTTTIISRAKQYQAYVTNGTMPEQSTDLLDQRLEDLLGSDGITLSVRTLNCLKAILDISTVGDLIQFTELELMRVPNLGCKTREEIKNALAANNLSLRKP